MKTQWTRHGDYKVERGQREGGVENAFSVSEITKGNNESPQIVYCQRKNKGNLYCT